MKDKYNFFESILFRESGLNPYDSQKYLQEFSLKHAITYFEVKQPGELVRDNEGNPVRKTMSYRDYFKAIGVSIDKKDITFEKLKQSCFSSINPWGFIGVQFGESALKSIKVYEPQHVEHNGREYPIYYDNVMDNSVWSFGREEALYDDGKSPFICTSINRWKGSFTGKFDINSIVDLHDPYKQRLVAHAIWMKGLESLASLLRIDSDIELIVEHVNKGHNLPFYCSLSALLSAIHLIGPQRLYKGLSSIDCETDEIGTSALSYMNEFNNLYVDKCTLESVRLV